MKSTKEYNASTTRDQWSAIQTALRFKIPYANIQEELNVTRRQIVYAKTHPTTPQKNLCGKKPLLRTPQRNRLEEWLHASPSHTRMPWRTIPYRAPELNLEDVGEKAMMTAFRLLGYCRRTSKKKGYSDDPIHKLQRVEFAETAMRWTRERVYNQVFSDEVWVMGGGGHTISYVTVRQDGSDRYAADNTQHKYRKAPAWMFHDQYNFFFQSFS